MDNPDILLQICIRVDNKTLESLSKTILWDSIVKFASQKHYWFSRTKFLLNREFSHRDADWKEVYYSFISYASLRTLSAGLLSNPIAVSILLETDYDPSRDDNTMIRYASSMGCSSAVKILLRDERVDPTAAGNDCIMTSSEQGHLAVVKLLLEDGRANPASNMCYAVGRAMMNRHEEVSRLLRQDPRVRAVF